MMAFSFTVGVTSDVTIKGGIVAASFAPGAVVSEVASRHEISPQTTVRLAQGCALAAADARNKSARKTLTSGWVCLTWAREQRDAYSNPFG